MRLASCRTAVASVWSLVQLPRVASGRLGRCPIGCAAAAMAMELLPGPEGVYAALAAQRCSSWSDTEAYSSEKIGLSKSAGLDVQLGGPIGDVSRASVRIHKGSLTERVDQFGRAPTSDKETDPDDSV